MQSTVAGIEGVQVWQEAADGRVCGDLVVAVQAADTLRILVLDGCGHGERARGMACAAAELAAHDLNGPINASHWRLWNAHLLQALPIGGFVAATLIEVSFDGPLVRLRNAGNPAPIRLGDGAARKIEPFGCVLGAVEGEAYDDPTPVDILLSEDQTLLVASDGLGDQRRGDERFADSALQAVLLGIPQNADDVLAIIHAAVTDFVGDGQPADDLTLVAITRGSRAGGPFACPHRAAA